MENRELENRVDGAAARLGEAQRAVGEVIVGQDRLVESLLVALLCRGHVLLEGVPGLAKTLTVRTLAVMICRTRVSLERRSWRTPLRV